MNTTTDSVRIVCLSKTENTFLVVSEFDDPMNFKLPGGKFNDEDESPIEAAERELREELGIVNVIDLKFAIELKTDDQLSRRFIYYCFIDNSKIKQTSEIHSIFWASEETLPECKNRKHMLSAVEAVYDVIKKQ